MALVCKSRGTIAAYKNIKEQKLINDPIQTHQRVSDLGLKINISHNDGIKATKLDPANIFIELLERDKKILVLINCMHISFVS